jgi:GNAT superfamily N-acetyltransferase
MTAVLNPESLGEAFLQVDPALRTPELEGQMLDTAEQHLAKTGTGGGRRLLVWSAIDDTLRHSPFTSRGYRPVEGNEAQQHRHRAPLGQMLLTPAPSGYVVRSLGDVQELPARSWASWRAFHPNELDSAYEGWEWYLNIQRAALYRRDLDIVAATADGTIAAFCTMWYDDVTRRAYIEPVGTVPKHQRHGLGRAVLTEGLARLWSLGATTAIVSGFSPGANALYDTAVGPDYLVSEPWMKELPSAQV